MCAHYFGGYKPTCQDKDLLPSLVSYTNLPYRYQPLTQVLVTSLTVTSGIADHSFYAQGQNALCPFYLSDKHLWHEPEQGPPRSPGQQCEEDPTTPFIQGEWLVTAPPLLPGNILDHLSGHVRCCLWDLHSLSAKELEICCLCCILCASGAGHWAAYLLKVEGLLNVFKRTGHEPHHTYAMGSVSA